MINNTLGTVLLTGIGEVQISERTGNPYFTLQFKQGPFGKTVTRVMWGKPLEDDFIQWARISPEEAEALKGHNLAGQVEIIGVEIEPENVYIDGELVTRNGAPVMVGSRTIVKFADENIEQATRRSGSVPRKAIPQEAPTAFQYVGVNGLEPA